MKSILIGNMYKKPYLLLKHIIIPMYIYYILITIYDNRKLKFVIWVALNVYLLL